MNFQNEQTQEIVEGGLYALNNKIDEMLKDGWSVSSIAEYAGNGKFLVSFQREVKQKVECGDGQPDNLDYLVTQLGHHFEGC